MEDVGAGYGHPETMQALRASQLKRRLIILATLINEASERWPGDVERGGLRSAYERLCAIDEQRPQLVEEMLLYPNTGAWLSYAMRRIRRGSASNKPLWPDLGYLGWLAASAAAQLGEAGAMPVVIRAGVVLLPGKGLAKLSSEEVDGVGEVRWDRSGLRDVRWSAVEVRVCEPSDGQDVSWKPLRGLRSPHGNGLEVYLDDVDPFRPLDRVRQTYPAHPTVGRLADDMAREWQEKFDGAWELLNRDFGGYAAPMASDLRAIVPLTASPTGEGASSASTEAFGSINMSAPSGQHQMALNLIHEFQHAKLGALTDMVRLHEEYDQRTFYAPWRDDPRPLGGLLQGIYAHIGVTEFWRVHRTRPDVDVALAEVEFARWRTQVNQALAEVRKSGLLTVEGVVFVDAMTTAVLGWRDERVSAEADTIAEETSTAHWVAWCVRNLAPQADTVRQLLDRWSSGQPAGEIPPSELVDQARVPMGHRSALSPSYMKLLASRTTFGGTPSAIKPSPGESAFMLGDDHQAISLFERELAEDPMHPRPWAGVVLAIRRRCPGANLSLLLRRADVVAHLFDAIRRAGGTGDLLSLSTWLSGSARHD
ncbi:HEXXH motif domain-containing protein [Asanoa ishikariensis]|uniref:HEXXH motif-containing protein n=1 Tax=Asanoa ishikariensis TaxID=137265 RepID=A0A1H3URV7_9ACTN|nr:HEXXH motif domain-containing protein [Asanoa ishikariensis]GIF69390.1 HEXXH motif domain-containing protein [Asanoa ishikariensis]SDZ65173.1 HEXXH motif-containing protein [Asanoa ishikariensis]